jgi:Tripartite tricarboxylate transporter TctB family
VGAVSTVRRISARRGEAAVAGLLFAVGAFFVWQASALDMGTVGLPGPGFFPLLLGLVLAVVAVGVVLRLRHVAEPEEPMHIGHPPVILTYLALLAVPLFFERIGALPTLGVFAAVVAMIIGRVSWWRACAGAAIGMAAAWYFFKVLLGVQLPAGIL